MVAFTDDRNGLQVLGKAPMCYMPESHNFWRTFQMMSLLGMPYIYIYTYIYTLYISVYYIVSVLYIYLYLCEIAIKFRSWRRTLTPSSETGLEDSNLLHLTLYGRGFQLQWY